MNERGIIIELEINPSLHEWLMDRVKKGESISSVINILLNGLKVENDQRLEREQKEREQIDMEQRVRKIEKFIAGLKSL